MADVTIIAVSLCRKLSQVYCVLGLLRENVADYWRFIAVFGVLDSGTELAYVLVPLICGYTGENEMNYVEKMMRDAKKEKQKQANKEHRKQMKKIDALINKANAILKK